MLGKRKLLDTNPKLPERPVKRLHSPEKTDEELSKLIYSFSQCVLDLDHALWVDLLDSAAEGNLKNVQRKLKYNKSYFKNRTGWALIKATENGHENVAKFILQESPSDIFTCQLTWAKTLARQKNCSALLEQIEALETPAINKPHLLMK